MPITRNLAIGYRCLDYKLFGKRAPVMASISVTGRCNLNCPYCYINVANRDPSEPSLSDLKQYVDEFTDMGTKIFFIQGGEPLIRKDIVELLTYMKRKGCYTSLSTNGTFSKVVPAMKGLLDHFELSLDGPREVNDRTRGKGVFDKVIRTAEIARECGLKFHFHSVLNVYNINEESLNFMAGLSTKFGTYFTGCCAAFSGYGNNSEFNSRVDKEAHRKGYDLLIKMKKQGLPIGNSHYTLKHARDWPLDYSAIGDRDNLPEEYTDQCVYGRLTSWLDHEGWLYPCVVTFGNEKYRENIRGIGIKQAWRNLSRIKCVACGIASDMNSLFKLKPESIIDAIVRHRF